MVPPLPLSLENLPLLVTARGEVVPHGSHAADSAAAILPGSFNPVHQGHWELAHFAERWLGRPVSLELSVLNVDKPELSLAEVGHRLSSSTGRTGIWLTRAPLFAQKAELFPGAIFVVGADTALRLVQPRYYADDTAGMLRALEGIRARGCRFLVAGRLDATGRFVTLDDLPVPADAFRCDVSSSALRRAP